MRRPPAKESLFEANQLLALAFRFYDGGNFVQAEELLRQILQAAPKYAPALHLLGVIAHQSGQTELGAQLLLQAVEIAPNEAQFHSNLGEMCRILKRLDEAVAHGEKAVALAPGLATAHSNLGIACYDKGDLDRARACQQRALTIDPNLPAALNNLGSILRDRKDRQAAIECYRKALAAAPGYAESASNLGSVLTETDRPEEALEVLLPLVQSNPDYAEAHCNIATAFLALEQLDKADFGFKRALALKAAYPEACIGLARVLQEQGDLPAAEAMAQRALAMAPLKAEVHSLLGGIYGESGYTEKARDAYARALELDPVLFSACLGRGHLLMENGDLKAAEVDFRRALSLDESNLGARLALAQVKKVEEGDANMAALIAEAAGAATLPDTKALPLHFALGKCYEDTKQYELAFRHYQEGCRLKRKRVAYSADDTELTARNIQEYFSAEQVARLRGAGCNSQLPIFVLGMPRSGTTLTETIIASHPMVYGAGELPDLLEIASAPRGGEAAGYPLNLKGVTQAELKIMGERYASTLQARAPGSPRITDKMPANFNFLGLIHLMLPGAKIVHVRRNPVDTCLSCYMQLFNKSQYQSYDLVEIGRYYRSYAQLMDHWRKVLPAGAFYEIRYEALVADPEGQARALLEYCGLEWDDACLDFHKTARNVRTASVTQVRQPMYKTSVEKWRLYERHLGPLLAALGDLVPR
jgi:tetratricopeptide (TPR) repeat protein